MTAESHNPHNPGADTDSSPQNPADNNIESDEQQITLPGEKIRTACLVLLTACAVGAVLHFLKGLLTPLLLALFLFYLIRPVGQLASRWSIPRWLTYSIVFTVLTIVIFMLGLVLYDNALFFVKRLPTYEQKLVKINDQFTKTIGLKTAKENFPAPDPKQQQDSKETKKKGTDERTEASEQEQQSKTKQDSPSSVLKALGVDTEEPGKMLVEGTVSVTEVGVMVLFYLVFMVLEARNLPRRINSRFSTSKASRYMEIGQNINKNVHQYLVYKTYISIGLGVTTGVLCALFGVPFALLWGVLMFLSNYITYIGSIVALLPPIALALLEPNELSLFGLQNPALGIVVGVVLTANRFLWIDYVEIRVLGKYLNVSPLLLLFSIAFFGYLWGVVGMLLAVPLVTTTKIILSHFENTQDYAVLMSEE